MGSAKAYSSGTATVRIPQIGANGGTIYVTVTGTGQLESEPVAVDFDEEAQTAELDEDDITVTNNPKGTKDTVVVAGLVKGDKIRVYSDDDCDHLLGYATASSLGKATVRITQLGTESGSIFVTVTRPGRLESEPVEVDYNGE